MNALITAAEAALADLKSRHHSMSQSCPGPAHCPTAAAIAALEVEIARAKRAEDPEFQAITMLSEEPDR